MLANYSKSKIEFTFTPHLTPMFRGILSTIYIDLAKGSSQSKIQNYLEKNIKTVNL